MQDQIGIPACFSSGEGPEPVTQLGQRVSSSVYMTKLAHQRRLITITWCKNLMLHGLSVMVSGLEDLGSSPHTCKVELKPWFFWRKQGSKRFVIDGKTLDLYWDLKNAKFNGETEPGSGYYVALACEQEVVLLIGDMKKDAYKKIGSRPSLFDPSLISKKDHIFSKKKFITRSKFNEKDHTHEISIEFKHKVCGSSNGNDPEMEVKIDGNLVVHVKHLQWKFRGNENINLKKLKIEVYWDVHDWIFGHGLRYGLFIFKPVIQVTSSPSSLSSFLSSPLSSETGSSGSAELGVSPNGSSEFSLFLYAWKTE